MVIFSDLHMGDGGRHDDFRHNSSMFAAALTDYYMPRGHTLVLNGDVEELQRFRYGRIEERWRGVYEVFDAFCAEGKLFKIEGNHDEGIGEIQDRYPIRKSLLLVSCPRPILLFHGHQASFYFEKFNTLIGYSLRYIAKPLGIKNYSVAHDSLKKFQTEKRVYDFSNGQGVVSVIGHTHRPLFESLSKRDSLKYTIERDIRSYLAADTETRVLLEERIRESHRELEEYISKGGRDSLATNLYSDVVIPSLFNSGCVIGKRGFTGIELSRDRMKLVHWFDPSVTGRRIVEETDDFERLGSTGYYRLVLKVESLEYICARIGLLTA